MDNMSQPRTGLDQSNLPLWEQKYNQHLTMARLSDASPEGLEKLKQDFQQRYPMQQQPAQQLYLPTPAQQPQQPQQPTSAGIQPLPMQSQQPSFAGMSNQNTNSSQQAVGGLSFPMGQVGLTFSPNKQGGSSNYNSNWRFADGGRVYTDPDEYYRSLNRRPEVTRRPSDDLGLRYSGFIPGVDSALTVTPRDLEAQVGKGVGPAYFSGTAKKPIVGRTEYEGKVSSGPLSLTAARQGTQRELGARYSDGPFNAGLSRVFPEYGRPQSRFDVSYERPFVDGGSVNAQGIASLGRGQDSMLVHMTPGEVQGLQALAMRHGGSLTINPQTGLPEAGFLKQILPMAAAAAAAYFSGGTSMAAYAPTLAGAATGALVNRQNPLMGAIMGGVSGYGIGGIGEGLTALGTTQAQSALMSEAAAQAALEGTTLPSYYSELAKATMPREGLGLAGLKSLLPGAENAGANWKSFLGEGATAAKGTKAAVEASGLGGISGAVKKFGMAGVPLIMGAMDSAGMGSDNFQTPANSAFPYKRYRYDPNKVAGITKTTPYGNQVLEVDQGFYEAAKGGVVPSGEERLQYNKTGIFANGGTVNYATGGELSSNIGGFTFDPVTGTYIRVPATAPAPITPTPYMDAQGNYTPAGGTGGAGTVGTTSPGLGLSLSPAGLGMMGTAQATGILGMTIPGMVFNAITNHMDTQNFLNNQDQEEMDFGNAMAAASAAADQADFDAHSGSQVDVGGDPSGMDGGFGGDSGGVGTSGTGDSGAGFGKAGGKVRSRKYALGGIASLYAAGGKLLRGAGDGMSDSIPAVIRGPKPQRAALADGEFVIPADVVSHLGNGSTDAGAKRLYAMMDKVRHARTGNKKQGKQINPMKFMPA